MAIGDGDPDRDLLAAWDAYCDSLKDTARLLFRDGYPVTPAERAESFRWLTHVMSLSFDWFVEQDGPQHPRLTRKYTPTRRSSGHNMSAIFHVAFIDGRRTYRICGNRGTARMWQISTLKQGSGTGTYHLHPYEESLVPESQLFGDALQTEWDGSFVLVLSPHPHEGNWIRTTPDTCAIRIRDYFSDDEREEPMRAWIECVGADGPPPPKSPDDVISALHRCGDYTRRLAEMYPDKLPSFPKFVENVFLQEQFLSGNPMTRGTDSNPGGTGATCHWVLDRDDALVIEFDGAGRWWALDVHSYWWQSADFRHRPVTLNSHHAEVGPDGRTRIVLAHTDPGVRNWLDTGGYSEGFMSFRFFESHDEPAFSTRRVPFAEVMSVLPEGTTRVDPDARKEQMRQRARSVQRRYLDH